MLDTPADQNAALINTILAIAGAVLLTLYAVIRHFVKSSYTPKGCRILGLLTSQSNLHDEFQPEYSQGIPENSIDEQGRPAWRVKALFTYPLKSCAGVELNEADVVATGFAFDRQFCFAEAEPCKDPKDGSIWVARTLRNRGFNKLALVRPEIWIPDQTAPGYNPELEEVKSRGVMVIHYPRVGRNSLHSAFIKAGIYFNVIPREASFAVPLHPPSFPNQQSTFPLTPVKIWKDNPLAYNYGHFIPSSFHRFLIPHEPGQSHGRHITLFRVNPSHTREIYRNAPRKQDLGFQPTTGFADAYPIHLLGLASVRDVNSHCEDDIQHLSIRRFRANVIIQGPGAFVEDDWKVIRISPPSSSSSSSSSLEAAASPSSATTANKSGGNDTSGINTNEPNRSGSGLVIHTACRTIRCKLPNVDPDTGFRHPREPDRTLKSYRRIDKGDLTNACLGMQGVPAVQESLIRVGDAVSVLETGEHCYIKMLKPGEVVEGV
ncbi:hypothetical protein ASPSYDRAFT_49252 [Aspergillus sydowii CBS 593.65]|uniref:MOSC domain-containing protein n=1 Tax=Aspergillus sydowii CBS 593.65 TaxID=1036612 RepID=A0A1L9T6R3_9EURO|nr:uncharacterized protein ASPSYDRAFT_49252 [Aspergillus sydowii CBS 593.65]OJJ55098.1 hypothetical protein ASPSYDRAFT_49252 [Aspergillus sydowii CBS 593.65]